MKQLWSGIKSVISFRNSSNMNVINKLEDPNGNITSDPAVVANIFNRFFVNVSHDITQNIPRSNKSPMDFMGDRVIIHIIHIIHILLHLQFLSKFQI